ncbi:2-dehydro-3-deoxygluconokinase [Alteromonas sp. KUL156]|nr:2-dehydro-3-deoxygluconokinase [Alteromonas sp. KUL154]GFD98939.1 2-dehydro-3-deoxygluconokinase [Alteromonas sp. KUL156]
MIGVFGEVMIELQPYGEGMFKRGVAGDTFNTAVMLSRLGTNVRYFSALGDDGFSESIRVACRHHGLPLCSMISIPGESPGMYAIENDNHGERTFTYWRSNSAAKQCFTSISLFTSLVEKAENCTAFYWSGITLSLMSEEVLHCWLAFLERQRAKGKLVFFDTNYRANLWRRRDDVVNAYQQAIAKADYFLPSDEDLKTIFKFSNTAMLEQFCAALPCITLMSAKRKACYWVKGELNTLPLDFSDTMVDATGAGDAFSGGFISGISQNMSIEQAIKKAHACASKVVQFKGAILPESQWGKLSIPSAANDA